MPEVLIATPVQVKRSYAFSDGISIRKLRPILWDQSIVNGFISKVEREELANTQYWLCIGKEVETRGDDLYDKTRHAALTLQVICPTGAKHIFLMFQETTNGYNNIGSYHPKTLCSTVLGRRTSLEDQGLQKHFDLVFQGIERAFNEKVVRLQNPVLLLEHGMQIGHVYLGALMFVMGLDMLFMAGESDCFVKRVGGFLGLDTPIFPPDSLRKRQPKTVVRDVLSDLYRFRNIIAHGREMPESPYRNKHDLISTDGNRINHQDYRYAELMHESSLFLLAACLRRILSEGLFQDVKEKKVWRQKLELYESCNRESGGPAAVKPRGR